MNNEFNSIGFECSLKNARAAHTKAIRARNIWSQAKDANTMDSAWQEFIREKWYALGVIHTLKSLQPLKARLKKLDRRTARIQRVVA